MSSLWWSTRCRCRRWRWPSSAPCGRLRPPPGGPPAPSRPAAFFAPSSTRAAPFHPRAEAAGRPSLKAASWNPGFALIEVRLQAGRGPHPARDFDYPLGGGKVSRSTTPAGGRGTGGWQVQQRQPLGSAASRHQCPPVLLNRPQQPHQAPGGGTSRGSGHEGGRLVPVRAPALRAGAASRERARGVVGCSPTSPQSPEWASASPARARRASTMAVRSMASSGSGATSVASAAWSTTAARLAANASATAARFCRSRSRSSADSRDAPAIRTRPSGSREAAAPVSAMRSSNAPPVRAPPRPGLCHQ